MFILWTLLITSASAHKVYESTEDIGPEAFQNVTTLYPVPGNNPLNKTDNNDKRDYDNHLDNDKNTNDTNSKEDKSKIDATVWKIDAAFSDSNLDDTSTSKENVTAEVVKEDTKEFKPSPHLGGFYDEENLQVTTPRPSLGYFTPVKKPSSSFLSSSKDDFRSSFSKPPNHIFQTHKQFPYKFESPILTRLKNPWRDRPDSLESKPTVEVPVRVPAGGFYKYEDPFREKPGNDDEDFGLGFTEDGKDSNSAVRKREGPWEHFLRLVTAFLPVGLIISALTPSIVTIENTSPPIHGNTFPSNIFRRSEGGAAALPVISERCRRRLLCELHKEKNYKTAENSSSRRGRQCYKIHCEDSEALARTLQWLLEYRRVAQKGHYT